MASTLKAYRFTRPRRQALYMIMALWAFGAIIFGLLPQILPVFYNSPYLNGLIIFVFVVGVIACFWQVAQLAASVRWINAHNSRISRKLPKSPRLLAPLAVIMKGDQLPSGMSTDSARSILDSVAIRLDEIRDITRYIINLLIFLGLLGTFYGLATTIPSLVETIRAMSADIGDDPAGAVSGLMQGLQAQLGGMGTAFGSSLIGLTGSLMVGLLELFAGHGQNRFYREFEEWLSHFTTVGMAEKGLELAIDPNDDTPLARAFRGLSDSLGRLDARLSQQNNAFEKINIVF